MFVITQGYLGTSLVITQGYKPGAAPVVVISGTWVEEFRTVHWVEESHAELGGALAMAIVPPVKTVDKRPNESLTYDIDFVNNLAIGETLSSVSGTDPNGTPLGVVAVQTGGPLGSALSLGAPAISGTTVQVPIHGGVAGCSYTLTFTALTSAGTREAEGVLNILQY